ncbi:ATP-binding protein [Gymnodinialimonas ulvae]|uniref:ATP-binding protein n=1 Tax=Gymnodinialimonas ulvae TaxID=3126504 RepID=UPI0030B14B92
MIDPILGAVPDPMLYIGADGLVRHANGAARAMLGDWILGRSHDAVLRQPGVLARIEAVQNGADAAEALFERSEHAGPVEYKVRITAIATPLGRALLLHFTDITHLREAEEMRRDFVANVSHELRTPLTAVLGFLETLRGSARDDPAAQDRFLGIMEDEANRMNRLVGDLLSLSRVEAEARVRPNDRVDMADLARAGIAALRPRAEKTGHTLAVELDDSAAAGTDIQGDRDQLLQVILNLTENAMTYGGPDKPVTLRLSRGESRGMLRGPVVQLDVIDRGQGIDSLHLPRLTERFYRVDTHRSREMGGTGLGLAIVKHIVNRHRGRLKITSETGQGSTFSVILPAA